MEMSLKPEELKEYVKRQADYLFPDEYHLTGKDVDTAFDNALERLEYCFQALTFRQYLKFRGGGYSPYFYHLYSDQYSQFLYFFAKELWSESQNKVLCDKLTLLNRSLHGVFAPYTNNLPDIFLFIHPVGTVLGHADYSDYLVIMQNVTVNTDAESETDLHLGKGVVLCAGAKIIGTAPIGEFVSIGVNVTVHDMKIPDHSIVYNDRSGKVIIKENKNYYIRKFFDINT